MPFFQLLMQILAALGPILQGPFAQKVLACLFSQSGVPAILACIAAAKTTTPEEAAAQTAIVSHLNAHIAANP
jgi:hypothetical protein